jgi:eukaryotic-like serine/threonine-protein kinase
MVNRVGQQLGNYRLTLMLSTGGFAEVYLAEHIHLGTQAAIKILIQQLDVQKFYEEARNIARLVHPNIVRLLDFGVDDKGGTDKTPFMIMDYAPNGTVADKFPEGKQVPLQTVVLNIKQVASALQYAHDEKIIHRDIKPENLLIGRRNEILLSDFGIAVIAHNTRSRVTTDLIGTVNYMAPEQIQKHPTPASDQYALGVIVYEWLTGHPPFDGTVQEVAVKHLTVTPDPLRVKVPTLSPAVEQVVLKALAKDPKQRFTSVHEFAIALEQASGTYAVPNQIAVANLSQSPVAPAGVSSSQVQSSIQRMGTTLFHYRVSPPSEIAAVVWSPDGKRIASTHEYEIYIHDSYAGKAIASYTAHSKGKVTDISWSPDGKWIVSSGEDGKVVIRDAVTQKSEFSYGGHFTNVNAVAWSPDGKRIVSGDAEGMVHVWEVATGYMVFNYRASEVNETKYQYGCITSVGWSPDGKWIISGSEDGFAQLYNFVYIYKLKLARQSKFCKVNSVVWSPDGSLVACGRAYTYDVVVFLVNFAATPNNWVNNFVYHGHRENVNALACSPVKTRIASASDDSTVQVWDAPDGRNVFTYRGHTSEVSALAWSPDGQYIASADIVGVVQIWRAG